MIRRTLVYGLCINSDSVTIRCLIEASRSESSKGGCCDDIPVAREHHPGACWWREEDGGPIRSSDECEGFPIIFLCNEVRRDKRQHPTTRGRCHSLEDVGLNPAGPWNTEHVSVATSR